MSVSLSPSNTLGFNRPLTEPRKQTLSISNHNAQPVAFKVKTTAPKLYCVRPNSGRIEPGESVDVSVMLQAMKEEPPLSAKCKDKFLIQSTIITPDKETMALQDIWNSTSDSEQNKIHQHKIRVVYLPPEGQVVEEEDEGHAGMSSMMSVPDTRYETVRQHPATNGHAVEPIVEYTEAPVEQPPAPPAPEPHPDDDLYQSEPSAPAPREPSPVPPSPVQTQPVIVSTPDPNAELLAKYNEAQAEINRLRALLAAMPEPSSLPTTTSNGDSVAPTELRKRGRALSDATSTMAGSLGPETEIGTLVDENVPPPEGVPLQVVIIIALGVFITTYLFF
ncbi:VAMP-associated protein [Gloeophyllum trabeum ATCC 11539]|uniref:VAMP-associated protein n=1 Tax=Gloeophyllum trabeum (strain ATCC 11539 / FP-39264 / Madison 617) TaxID=670483 RepID=S7Q4N5_GLOTA|nr:VAMP-associated protein [Gloeophyllum trabeum ATCC 11539]EPQ54448.1 VAMP-associated protein [Gloeophyllum trabeum ATCC 11539]